MASLVTIVCSEVGELLINIVNYELLFVDFKTILLFKALFKDPSLYYTVLIISTKNDFAHYALNVSEYKCPKSILEMYLKCILS